MSAEREDFLLRWSRRKLLLPGGKAATGDATPALAPKPQRESEPTLTDEEIAALPKIEDLTAETDITAFLQNGVPAILRKAALRRVWTLDPNIRDYRSEAREYAYDWNVPGGVPGNGPLLPTDDVEAMLRQVFGDVDPTRESGRTNDAVLCSSELPVVSEDSPSAYSNTVQYEATSSSNVAGLTGTQTGVREVSTGVGLQENNSAASPSAPAPRRRHGGAAPV
jgi:hypothetical protein